MPTTKVTGTQALLKLREERAGLEQREALARREAAAELGGIALEAGAEAMPARDLKALLTLAVAIGPAKSVELLRASADSAAGRRGSAMTAVANGHAEGSGHAVS